MLLLTSLPVLADDVGFSGTFPVETATATIEGARTAPGLGSAQAAGDFDGDGHVDLLLGAPGDSSNAGAAFVALGPLTGTISADDLFRLDGLSNDDDTGAAVALLSTDSAGAVAVQTTALLIGAPGAGDGIVYLTDDASTALSDAATLTPAAGSARLGAALAALDVDGDGRNDVVVGAPGGRDSSPGGQVSVLSVDAALRGSTSTEDADHTLTASSDLYRLGHALCADSRLLGDGYGAILLGAVEADSDNTDGTAVVQLYAVSDLLAGQSDPMMTLYGGPLFPEEILSIAALSDVDGGVGVAVGFPDDGTGSSASPFVHVLATDGHLGGVRSVNGAKQSASVSSALAPPGLSLSGGDTDGDGTDELLVGTTEGAGLSAGLLFAGLTVGTLDGGPLTASFTEAEPQAHRTALLADLTGDGAAEVIIGAPTASVGGSAVGRLSILPADHASQDADSDGYTADIDCDDQDPDASPGHEEVCADRIDNDCDGYADNQDDDCSDPITSPPDDSGPTDTDQPVPDSGIIPPGQPRWCAFRGGGFVFTLLMLLPMWLRCRRPRSPATRPDHPHRPPTRPR